MLTFFPPSRSRGEAIAAGFRIGQVSTHTSRTMMLNELSAALAAVRLNGKPEEYRVQGARGIRPAPHSTFR